MERSFNLGQFVIPVVKIIVLLFLPIIMFTIPLTGIPIPGIWVTGIRMYLMGNMLIIIPTIVYALMLLFSIGQMQSYSFFPAIVAILLEFFMLFGASLVLKQGDIAFLISLIPEQYVSYVQFGLDHMANPGYAVFINLVLSIAYIVLHYVPIGGSGFRAKKESKGMQRPSISSNNDKNISGGINKPTI